MIIPKESFLLVIFISIFLPKYGVIDPTIISSILILPVLVTNNQYQLSKIGILIVSIIASYLIFIPTTFIQEFNDYHILQLQRDVKILISSIIVLFINGFSEDLKSLKDKISSILILLLKVNIIIMSIQLLSPDLRIRIMEFFNFGYGLDEFETFHLSSLRPSGTFQSYDIASIILSLIILLGFEKLLTISKLWLILGIMFTAITARTGLILILVYITFKKPLYSIIFGILAIIIAMIISNYNPLIFQSYLWLKDDVAGEINALATQINYFNLFGNRLPSYQNNSLSDVGYEHILLTYGFTGLFLILSYYLVLVLKSQKPIRTILAIVIFIGSFKTNLFTPSLFLILFHFLIYTYNPFKSTM